MSDIFWWVASLVVLSIILMFSIIGVVTTIRWVIEHMLV